MSGLAQDAFYRLPSADARLTEVCEDAAARSSVALIVPAGHDVEAAQQALLRALRARDIAVDSVDVTTTPGATPLAALDCALEPTWPAADTPRTLANLLRCPRLPDAILLASVAALPEGQARAWLDFIHQWARAAHAQAGTVGLPEPPSLVVILPGDLILARPIEPVARLEERFWWGVPSALELRLLCRQLGDGVDTAADRWREHVLPALAGPDPALFAALWGRSAADLEEIQPVLTAHAAGRGWTADALTAWGAPAYLAERRLERADGAAPPVGRPRALWARGALWRTVEFGVELHPAALAALGEQAAVRHRLWRGQAGLLLPELDDIRLLLCDHLTERHGGDWAVRWLPPSKPEEEAAVREDARAAEWRHIETTLRKVAVLRDEWRWKQVATLARDLRNRLAHYQPVAFRDYTALLELTRSACADSPR